MASTWSSVVVYLHQPGHNGPILSAQNFKMGSVLHTLVFHLLLWNELLLENAAFASATDAAIYQDTWLPENYTYTNVGVFVDVTTLVQCAVFSQRHEEEHNAINFQRGIVHASALPWSQQRIGSASKYRNRCQGFQTDQKLILQSANGSCEPT